MLVPLEDDVDAVFDEQRFELRPQPDVRAAPAEYPEAPTGGRVDRVVHGDHLPAGRRLAQRAVEPFELRGVDPVLQPGLVFAERVGIEHEDLDERRPAVGRGDRVVTRAVNVAELRRRQVRGGGAAPGRDVGGRAAGHRPARRPVAAPHIVVAERRVDGHAKVQDGPVDVNEPGLDVLGLAVFVDVVAQQEQVRRPGRRDRVPDRVPNPPGAPVAGAGVADEDHPHLAGRRAGGPGAAFAGRGTDGENRQRSGDPKPTHRRPRRRTTAWRHPRHAPERFGRLIAARRRATAWRASARRRCSSGLIVPAPAPPPGRRRIPVDAVARPARSPAPHDAASPACRRRAA